MGQLTQALQEKCRRLGRRYVGFRGDPYSPIWFIGEAPGADEDQLGTPFVGASGKELDRMLREAGLPLGLCCFTNPYKVRPPGNDITKFEETGIGYAESVAQFLEELAEYQPKVIVALGGTPLNIICGFTANSRDKESKISKWRGSILASDSPQVRWPHVVIPCFHPAYILREWADRDVVVFILRRVKEEYEYFARCGRFSPLPERQLIADPSFGEARDYLNECLNSELVSIDIELLARRVPICVGFSCGISSAVSISLFDGQTDNLRVLWRLMDRVLREKTILGQNWTTFDANWLEALGFGSGIERCHDTLVRHHVLHPELSHKLDFQVMQYTRQPYFKDEGKGWQLREGLTKLKRYNCLDAVTTLEVYHAQEEEFRDEPTLRSFYEDYEMPLARAFHRVDKRGIYTDSVALQTLRKEVVKELDDKCVEISKGLSGKPVVYSADMGAALASKLNIPKEAILNISSVTQLKEVLKNELKIKLKTDRKTGRESTGEDSLNEAFASTGNAVLKNVLRIRELNKVLGTYIDTRLGAGVFYSCYSVTGTVTGRRASRKNFLGFGSNGQNQPKHSDLGERFQGVFVARPNHIFIACDQASAEEWIVQGIIADVSGDLHGIKELEDSVRTGVSRHARLASQIFGLPLDRTNNKECLEYYIGKKVRHAGNYDMREDKMAMVVAAEGFPMSRAFCAAILTKFHEVEPAIRQVFHAYIQHELTTKRFLKTPFGRERVFHGLRPYGDNGRVFREGYAYIPQSTIGDNNGLAILYCEQSPYKYVIQDGHDSILLEVPDTLEDVILGVKLLLNAYDRVVRFPNGFSVKIPIDFRIGYSMKGLKKCIDPSQDRGWTNMLKIYSQLQSLRQTSTSGQELPPLVQRSSEIPGSTGLSTNSTQTSTPS